MIHSETINFNYEEELFVTFDLAYSKNIELTNIRTVNHLSQDIIKQLDFYDVAPNLKKHFYV